MSNVQVNLTELKPCPFCGDQMENRGYGAIHVDPKGCPIGGYAIDPPEKWNVRSEAALAHVAVAPPPEWVDKTAEDVVEKIFADLRGRSFLKWVFDERGSDNFIGFLNGERFVGIDLEVQDVIKAKWADIIRSALVAQPMEPTLFGPYGYLNGHKALSEDEWTLENDPLENNEQYFSIPLFTKAEPPFPVSVATPPLQEENATQQEPVAEAHPLAKFGSPEVTPLGLYRIHWKSGGSSLAAIGMMSNGDRWIAPTNWIRPGTMPSAGEWGDIERLEPIDVPATQQEPVALREVMRTLDQLLVYPISTEINRRGYGVRHDEGTVLYAVQLIHSALKRSA